MKRSKTKPLPCPFCGHEYKGEYVGAGIGSGNRFECPYCGALGPFPTGGKRGETAVEAWNLRVEKVLVTRKPRTRSKVVLPLLLALLLSACGKEEPSESVQERVNLTVCECDSSYTVECRQIEESCEATWGNSCDAFYNDSKCSGAFAGKAGP